MIRHLVLLTLVTLFPAFAGDEREGLVGDSGSSDAAASVDMGDLDALVYTPPRASRKARERALSTMVSMNTYRPNGAWGETH